MPVLTQLNLNVGTEQNPNMVLHDLHDIRISSTDVTTVTRLLGCDAGVNSIAPITLANAASLLGGIMTVIPQNTNLDSLVDRGKKYISTSGANSSTLLNLPNTDVASAGFELEYFTGYYNGTFGTQILYNHVDTFIRSQHLSNGTVFGEWYKIKREPLQ